MQRKKYQHVFHHYKKDQFIYFNTDPSNQIYLIATGRVKIATLTEDGKEVLKANLTGTSRQTVTKIMNDLKENNLINFNRKQILFRDIEVLKKEFYQISF